MADEEVQVIDPDKLELHVCDYCAAIQEDELNLYHGDGLCSACFDEVFSI